MAITRRLQPDDWAEAALDAIAEGGVPSVAVETLVPKVGASKGSFYWHFADRAALVEAAVLLWEQTRTEDLISGIDGNDDPRRRLRGLFEVAFTNPKGGRVEAALAAQRGDPVIGPVLRRVTARRLRYLGETFAELGFDGTAAKQRALCAYTIYLGFFSVRDAGDELVPTAPDELARFLDALVELLSQR